MPTSNGLICSHKFNRMKSVPFLVVILLCTASCKVDPILEDKTNIEDGNFTIRDNMLGVKTQIGENFFWLLFDTGVFGHCDLDDEVIKKIFSINKVTEKTYNLLETIMIAGVSTGHKKVGSTLKFPFISKTETPEKILPFDFFAGIIGPNFDIDTRIWEINFEHRNMKIHEHDTIPSAGFAFPINIKKGYPTYK